MRGPDFKNSVRNTQPKRLAACRAWLFLVTLLPSVGMGATDVLAADEPTGIEAVASLEKVIVAAIAKAEKSVVAIARVRKGSDAEPKDKTILVRPDGKTRLRIGGEVRPTDPDFVASEYGAGVVVDASGLILTTYHVLGELEKCDFYVWSGRKPYLATVKAADPYLDLAVLKVEATDLVPMKFGAIKETKKGQIVIVLGNPQGIARDGEASAAWGIIANVGRRPAAASESAAPREGKAQLHDYGTLLQFDARLNAGGSGGALVNLKGEMIGLTTALAAGGGSDVAGGFAIPVDELFLRAVEKLKAGKKVDLGFLGVAPENLSLDERQHGKTGARVYQAVPGTPAALAGLRGEDPRTHEVDVITQVNGNAIHDSNSLFLELSKFPPGERVQLTVARGPRTADLKTASTVKLEARLWKKGNTSDRPVVGDDEFPAWRGLRIDYASAVPAFRDSGSDFDPQGCVGILEVQRDSPAWKAGLRPTMFICFVDKTRVGSPADFFAAVKSQTGKVAIRTSATGNESPEHVIEVN